MRGSSLFVTLLLVTWITASESLFVASALALGGLAALKGAALVGFAAGRGGRRRYYGRSYGHNHGSSYGHRRGYGHGSSYGSYGHGRGYGSYGHGSSYGSYGNNRHGYRYGRSVENSPAEAGEDLLLAAVGQMDPNGCILKLLCQVEIKEESRRTIEESILVDMFANATEDLSANSAAFVYATEIGIKTQDPAACKKYFPNCPLNEEQLDNLLQQAWGCGFNFDVDGETEEEQQEEVVEDEVPTMAPSEVSLLDIITNKPTV